MMLSVAVGTRGGHSLPLTPVEVSTSIPARTEVEPNRGVNPGDADAREAEEVAAAAAAASSKEGFTIPLVDTIKSTKASASEAARDSSDSSRYLKAGVRDELVAWSVAVGGGSTLVTTIHHLADLSIKPPEASDEAGDSGTAVVVSARKPELFEKEALPSPEGSDLLAGFLPADKATLDRAIGQLLDGIEGIGPGLAGGVEAAGEAGSPILWGGVAIVAVEVLRRRLRRFKSGEKAEDGADPVGGFSPGFLA